MSYQKARRLLKRVWTLNVPRKIPKIVRMVDHDPSAFTQGLAYHDGQLYESTGLTNSSSLRKLSVETGEIEKIRPMPEHWAEGIAYKNGEIVQLTWTSMKAFVFGADKFDALRSYELDGEGWGLTSSDTGFISTDGSERLIFRDDAFTVTGTLEVKINGFALKWLNDLVFAQGTVFINRLGDASIYQVSLLTGSVISIIDCSILLDKVSPLGPEDVLNGIAYIADREEFVVTGKRWDKLFFLRF
ncbi:MAG: glutaminyl-peptide cyclotransferase [Halioglobus sp.]